MKEITLSNGARLRVRPVPPHVYLMFKARINANMPPEPKPPVVEFLTKAGHVERGPAGEDHPAWQQYIEEREKWQKEQARAFEEANSHWLGLLFDYAIQAWSWDGETWQTDAAEDWRYPAALLRAGLNASDNHRLDYILLELLVSPSDVAAVLDIAESRSELREEEVQAAQAGFRRGNQQVASSRRIRDHQNALPRRDGNSESVGKGPGFLVSLFKRSTRHDGSV